MTHRRGGILPLLATLLAVVCLAAAFASRTPERGTATTAPQATPAPDKDVGSIKPVDFFDPEPGPGGVEGRWLGAAASIRIRADGTRWLAFGASSLRRSRALTFDNRSETLSPVEVTEETETFVVGPFRVDKRTAVRVTPDPGPRRAAETDTRQVSVFVSGLRLLDEPVVAVPGDGFYAEETAPGGQRFNWMRPNGVIEVTAAGSRARRVWLLMQAGAPDSDARKVTARSGGQRDEFTAPPGGAEVTIGPFPLRDGRARIRLEATPGPASIAGDDRRLSVLVTGLRASLRPPPG